MKLVVQMLLLCGISIVFYGCIVATTNETETKDFHSVKGADGIILNLARAETTTGIHCIGNKGNGRNYQRAYADDNEEYLATDLSKCELVLTKITANGDKYPFNINAKLIEKGVSYFCPEGTEGMCQKARDALGNLIDILFLTSQQVVGESVADYEKYFHAQHKVTILPMREFPPDSKEFLRKYPAIESNIPVTAYLIRIYSYLNAILPETDGMPALDLHYRCDGCWKNVISKGDSYNLQKVIKVGGVCVAFKHEGESVQVYFEKTLNLANTVRISEDTKEKQKVDKKVMLSCHNSVPHLMLTCVGISARYIHRCNNMSQAIGTMPIKRDHIDKTVCAKLPEVYNQDGYKGIRKNIRAKAILKELSYPNETVTFRTTTTSCRKDELSIGISLH